MTASEIKQAVDNGRKVHWSNKGYTVIKDNIGQYLIMHDKGNCTGLTWSDGVTLNGDAGEFFIDDSKTHYIDVTIEVTTDKPLERVITGITKGIYMGLDREDNYIASVADIKIDINEL